MKEILRNGLAAVVLGTAAVIGVKAAENQPVHADNTLNIQQLELNLQTAESDNQDNELKEDLQKLGLTIIGATLIGGATFIGYRYSDGARNRAEKYFWLVVFPTGATVGISFVVTANWL